MRERISDQLGGGAVWAVEIWIAAGVAAGSAALVGQRHHRTRNVRRVHRGHDGQRIFGDAVSRPRICRGIDFTLRDVCGAGDELWHLAGSRG